MREDMPRAGKRGHIGGKTKDENQSDKGSETAHCTLLNGWMCRMSLPKAKRMPEKGKNTESSI